MKVRGLAGEKSQADTGSICSGAESEGLCGLLSGLTNRNPVWEAETDGPAEQSGVRYLSGNISEDIAGHCSIIASLIKRRGFPGKQGPAVNCRFVKIRKPPCTGGYARRCKKRDSVQDSLLLIS